MNHLKRASTKSEWIMGYIIQVVRNIIGIERKKEIGQKRGYELNKDEEGRKDRIG